MKKLFFGFCLAALLLHHSSLLLAEQNSGSPQSNNLAASSSVLLSNAASALAKAAQENKFIYVLVQNKQDDQTSAVRKTVEATVQKLPDTTVWVEIDRNKPADKEVLEKYDLLRAPLPLVLSIAPNGAVTAGLIGKQVTSAQLEGAIVSTGFQKLMKAMQDKKLVLLCCQNKSTTGNEAAMKGVNEFKADPKFAADVEIIQVDPADAHEAELLTKLKISPQTSEAVTALLAPPGTPLGLFAGATSKDKIESTVKAASSGGCAPGTCGPNGCP